MISIPGRIPIHIHPMFWFLIFMIGWINTNTFDGTMIWAVVVFLSVLIHEYGHALTAVAFGQTAEISLVALGGLTSRRGGQLSRWKEFAIVFDGPLMGFMLFLLLSYFKPALAALNNPYLNYGVNIAIQVNLFWTILNLLPVWPLDGGQLTRIILEGLFGHQGFKACLLLSVVLGALLGLFFFSKQQLWIGMIFLMLAFESYRAWNDASSMTAEDTKVDLQNGLQDALRDAREGRTQQALSKFLTLKEQTGSGILHVAATQNIARILADQGHYQQAYDSLKSVKKQLSGDYLALMQQLAFRLQKWEETADIGTEAYQTDHSADVAVLNALAYGIMGTAKPAVGWLQCAVKSGYPDVLKVASKREFDAIRPTTEFQNWLKANGG